MTYVTVSSAGIIELAQKPLLGESFVNQPMSIHHHWKNIHKIFLLLHKQTNQQTNKMSFKDNKYYNKIMSSEKSYVYAATAVVAVIAVAAGTTVLMTTTRKTK